MMKTNTLLRLYTHTRNFLTTRFNFLTNHRRKQRWRQWKRKVRCILEILKASIGTAVHEDSTHLHSLALPLTEWNKVLPEKLTGLQLVKIFPAFNGTRNFITSFTSARHLFLSWANSHSTSWRSILILSSHLYLVLPPPQFNEVL